MALWRFEQLPVSLMLADPKKLRNEKCADESENIGIEDQILPSYRVRIDPDDGKEQ